jgi:hypothetical protein
VSNGVCRWPGVPSICFCDFGTGVTAQFDEVFPRLPFFKPKDASSRQSRLTAVASMSLICEPYGPFAPSSWEWIALSRSRRASNAPR